MVIVLTGGPSNIPQIKKYIHDFFDGKEIITSKNPEQTVVSGVSIHAEIWKSDINCRNRCDVFVVNEINKTTGIRTSNQIKLDFIKSGHYIWENIEKGLFTTSHDSQKKVIIQVYEGERVKINDSHLIGTFEFKIKPAPRGVAKIQVKLCHHYCYNDHDFYKLTVKDLSSGNYEKWIIDYDNGKYPYENVNQYQEEDDEYRKKIEAKNKLDLACVCVKNFVNDNCLNSISELDKVTINNVVNNIFKWIKSHKNATINDYQNKMKKLERELKNLHFENSKIEEMLQKNNGFVGCLPDEI